MIKFNQLHKKRQHAIRVLMQELPSFAETGVIAGLDLMAWWDAYKQRPDREIGFPLWIRAEAEFRGEKRGTYKLPLPESSDPVIAVKPKNTLSDHAEEDVLHAPPFERYTYETFMQECNEEGVTL